ncbi:hypothetical protein AB0F25_13100 [Streptomyces wedmorensis]|uniref:hypothetical protein n=1 Tax=Streptomyces wedmorensis TaxID=43759 RepID=UPI0034131BCC
MPESLPYPVRFLRVSFDVYVGRVERMTTPGADTAFCAPKSVKGAGRPYRSAAHEDLPIRLRSTQ